MWSSLGSRLGQKIVCTDKATAKAIINESCHHSTLPSILIIYGRYNLWDLCKLSTARLQKVAIEILLLYSKCLKPQIYYGISTEILSQRDQVTAQAGGKPLSPGDRTIVLTACSALLVGGILGSLDRLVRCICYPHWPVNFTGLDVMNLNIL